LDRTRYSTLAHRDHVFCSPLSDERASRLLDSLALARGARVLDAGCGKAELLIRAIERFDADGVGLDWNGAFLSEGRARAAGRVRTDRLVLLETDAAKFRAAPESFDAIFCLGASQCFGGYRGALATLAPWTRRGGVLLFGEGYWKREPDPEYLAALGGTREEAETHDGNIALGVAAGLTPVADEVSSEAEWDAYERMYAGALKRFVAEHPDDPDADASSRAFALGVTPTCAGAATRWGSGTTCFGGRGRPSARRAPRSRSRRRAPTRSPRLAPRARYSG
jgi:SAM-dependent methyltransferase